MSLLVDDKQLAEIALDYREAIIRMSHKQPFGIHIGGSLSLAEVFTVLYYAVAHIDPQQPDWAERDRIVLSKGHANVGLLTMLAMRGFFSPHELDAFNTLGSHYSMHADSTIPGVEHSAGSLGHGLSVAVGMALAAQLDEAPWHVYCIVGDGEAMEGSIWEAMMSAQHFGLSNLTLILDRNGLSQEGTTHDVMALDPLDAKAKAFGWHVIDVDGHSIPALREALAASSEGKPKLVIANTVKGNGVPSHEGQIQSHFAALSDEQASAALDRVSAARQELGKGG